MASSTRATTSCCSLTDHADPSSADTTAGFEFAFDCGDGTYSDFTGTGTLSCPAADNGPSGQQLDVGGKIRDKDGGVTEYRAGVIVLQRRPVGDVRRAGVGERGQPDRVVA